MMDRVKSAAGIHFTSHNGKTTKEEDDLTSEGATVMDGSAPIRPEVWEKMMETATNASDNGK